jgi:SP family arabinose:H+ symporter-like MFS transporter
MGIRESSDSSLAAASGARARRGDLKQRSIVQTALVGASCGCIFGFNMHTVTGAVIFLKREFELSPSALGFAVSCAMLGCVAGAGTAALLADRLGRKRTLAATALLLCLGTAGTVYATNVAQFDVFRTLSGIGVGLVSVVSPMYMAEISPARMRGRMVTVNQLAIVISGFLSVMTGYFYAPSANWRAMFAFSFVPVGVLLALLPMVPESPRWLVKRGRSADARTALQHVYRDENIVASELGEMSGALDASVRSSASFRDLFASGVRRALVTGVALALCVQLTGISAIGWYVPIVLQRAGGQSITDVMLHTVGVNGWQVLCSLAAMFAVDRLGRRPLLLVGTLGMALSMMLVGIVFARSSVSGRLAELAIMLAMGFYNFSLAPLFWLLISEIFPTPFRAKGMAVSSLVKWLAAFSSAQMFPILTAYSDLLFKTIAPVFWLFAVVCIGAFVFGYRSVPETRNRTLEQIGRTWQPRSGC